MNIKVPNTNIVIIAGRATRDGELNYTEGGSAYLNIGIANNQNWRNKQGEWVDNTVFANATLWGKAAERLQNKIKKGNPIIIEGKLSSYTREVEGKKQTTVSINAFKVQLLEKEIQPQEETLDELSPEHDEKSEDERDVPF